MMRNGPGGVSMQKDGKDYHLNYSTVYICRRKFIYNCLNPAVKLDTYNYMKSLSPLHSFKTGPIYKKILAFLR